MDSPHTPPEVLHTLAAGRAGKRHRWLYLGIGAAAVVLAAVLLFGWGGGNAPALHYKTAPVQRGNLRVTVSATGTLQPVNQVDVGSELSGTIAAVNVDYNDHVTRGQPLAQLDTELLQARLVEARASLQSAQAKVQEAAATVTETKVALKRCQDLVPRQMCSGSDLDKLRADYQRAQAGEAAAKATQAQVQASLSQQETNLRKAVIRSPIDGVVLDRKVEKGQTVAASFQTPVLFTLAEDLAQMELLVSVDEADIGQVREGQTARFTVDAYPNRVFDARVTQIRHAPVTVEGVVTYQTVLGVDNKDLALLPGMTATADILVNELHDVLLVPNAALRFAPSSAATATRSRGLLAILPRPPHTRSTPVRAEPKSGYKQVWTLRDNVPTAVTVKIGASDGAMSEVQEGDLKAGMAVITDTVGNGG